MANVKKIAATTASKTIETTETVESVDHNTIQSSTLSVSASDVTVQENKALKEQLEELKAQMAIMAQMMGVAQVKQNTPKRLVRFVNMLPGTYVLKGTTIWKIEGQFNYRDVSETEATVIYTNMHSAIANGNVYIADAQFVADHDLTEVYQHLLTPDQFKQMLTGDSKQVLEMYKIANDAQKKMIVDMFVDKKFRGEEVDGAILYGLGKLSGRDLLGIEPMDVSSTPVKEG